MALRKKVKRITYNSSKNRKTVLSLSPHLRSTTTFSTENLLSLKEKHKITIVVPKTTKAFSIANESSFKSIKKFKDNNDLTDSEIFSAARKALDVGAIPDVLLCREAEFDDIFNQIDALKMKTGCCLYVSGVPGTGKTATFYSVLRNLRKEVDQNILEDFDFVEINGLKVTDATQAYSTAWEAVSGIRLPPGRAHIELMNKFSSEPSNSLMKELPKKSGKNRENNLKSDSKMLLVLLDELDLLMRMGGRNIAVTQKTRSNTNDSTNLMNSNNVFSGSNNNSLSSSSLIRRQEVVYNFLEWTANPRSQVIVVAISNTMDLPEREMSGRLASRLGNARINFYPYNETQLAKILRARLQFCPGVLSNNAIEFVARKIGVVHGDARRLLSLCSRAVDEKLESNVISNIPSNSKAATSIVDVQDINACLETHVPPSARYLEHAPKLERLIMGTVLRQVRLRRKRATVSRDSEEIDDVCVRDLLAYIEETGSANRWFGRSVPSNHIYRVLVRLADYGLLLVETCGMLRAKVRLNINEVDLARALRNDEDFGAAGIGSY